MISTASQPTNSARSAIMDSIRRHLAASNQIEMGESSHEHDRSAVLLPSVFDEPSSTPAQTSMVATFRESLEAVGGHCFIVRGEIDAAIILKNIFARLPASQSRRVALSDAPILERLARDLGPKVKEVATTPKSNDLFNFDVGITTAQLAIAETGTLVLESESERHRLVSLVPPVHIAILDARSLVQSLGEALSYLQREGISGMSRAVTFITGPSRTADIELTLTVGVHGPKELHVIVIDSHDD